MARQKLLVLKLQFELHSKIGEGAFGEVWKAWMPLHSQWAAVKRPKKTRRHLDALEKEAVCLARIRCDGVPFFIACARKYEPFLAMEFVYGVRLDQWLKKPMSKFRAKRLQIIYEIARTLMMVHERFEIFHRDLKTENIIITSENKPKVLDFGVAKTKLLEEQTMDARHAVNIRNSAPEYLEHMLTGSNKPFAFTSAQDVWSLGCVAHQVLFGSHPFEIEGDLMRTIALIRSPKLDSALLAKDNLGPLVERMLSREPDARPSMAELIAEIEIVGFRSKRTKN